jgi:hypothetical protein
MILDANWSSQLGNLPSIQGDDDHITWRRPVPPRAVMLLAPENAAGFA